MPRKWIVRTAGTAAALTVLIGALHLPAARPLLALAGAVCPVGGASAREVEEARQLALRSIRGSDAAPARPAFGFALERTTEADVRAWASANRVACESSREATLLVCTAIPAAALPDGIAAVDELAFGFRLRDHRLVNVSALTSGVAEPAAARSLEHTAAALEAALGRASSRRLPPASWDGRPAFVRYRFADYVADVSAMRLPGRGIVMREQYMSAVE
jgi:hypothetical protein